MATRVLSLKERALACLARREYSRLELARKLAPHAQSEAEVERVLDALERGQFLSSERFAESLAHRRAERFGVARICAELKQHRLAPALVEAHVESLRTTEVARAREVWRKRFGVAATTVQERARHMRFLAARGFSAEAIRAVVAGDDDA